MSAVRRYGGDKGDRTPDLLHAMQALSQLSYAPALFALTGNSIAKRTYIVKDEFSRWALYCVLASSLGVSFLICAAQDVRPPRFVLLIP